LDFKLDGEFVKPYSTKKVEWGFNGLGELTYYRTYSRLKEDGTNERWWETVERVVNGIYSIQKEHILKQDLGWNESKAQSSAKEMYDRIFSMKFLPPGRGLWSCGTEIIKKGLGAAMNNCFSGDTLFITPHGTRKLADCVGEEVKVLTKIGHFEKATINSFGVQELQEVILKPFGLRSNLELTYKCTPNHRWILEDGTITTSLKVGDKIVADPLNMPVKFMADEVYWNTGFAHGLIFGDGTRHTQYPDRHIIQVCDGHEDRYEAIFKKVDGFVSRTDGGKYPTLTIVRKGENWKELPVNKPLDYIKGFIAGWCSADSHVESNGSTLCLDTQNEDAANWLIDNCIYNSLVPVGISYEDTDTNYGKRKHRLCRVKLSTNQVVYKVIEILPLEKEEVFCATEPLTSSFMLSSGIVTGNCGFISTEHIDKNFSKPFCFMMDMSALGVGIGFDLKGENKIKIGLPNKNQPILYQIPDSREGWVESLKLLLESYVTAKEHYIEFDYSLIRKAGTPIKTFGGISSGYKPLQNLHTSIRQILDARIEEYLTATDIADIMNLVGVCIVSGNVRRSAQIVFGSAEDEKYLDLKNYKVNPHREYFGWSSNNSVFCDENTNYKEAADRTSINGEPGYFWLKNAQKYGRMVDGVNNKDKLASGGNPCVIGETEVLTKKGYIEIKDLINQEVEIWNGFEWSLVTPKITGYNQHILKITLSDGRELSCTDYHKWYLAQGYTGKSKEVQAKDLKIGDKIIKYNFPILRDGEVVDNKKAYTQGFISAEGMDDYNFFWLYEPKFICSERLDIRSESNIYRNINNVGRKTVRYTGIYESKDFVPLNWSIYSKLEWLAGLLDGDGTELIEGGCQLGSTNISFIRDVQKLLSILGVNSKICKGQEEGNRMMPNGKGGMKEYYCNETYRLCIGAIQIQQLKELGLNCIRLKFNKLPQRDASQFVKVVKIEDCNNASEVYCFNEPIRHYGVFNGILTGQCLEQTLENFELCCLVETFPASHESLEDYKKTLKYAYLYAKSVTLLKTHCKDTNRVLLRNRRIGLSQTGIAQFLENHSLEEYREWCDDGYKTVQKYDEIYSNWFCIPKSIKTTSIKPSGSISLLAGASPGMHFPEDNYYIRRIRIGEHSPLIQVCKNSNYHIEKDVYDDSSYVVEIPVEIKCRTIKDVSIWEQVELASFIQKWWADNQVSCTVTFSPNEAKEILPILNYHKYDLKGISFLPKVEKGAYKQMPYEAITKEKYDRLVSKIKPLQIENLSQDAIPELYCDSEKCEIK